MNKFNFLEWLGHNPTDTIKIRLLPPKNAPSKAYYPRKLELQVADIPSLQQGDLGVYFPVNNINSTKEAEELETTSNILFFEYDDLGFDAQLEQIRKLETKLGIKACLIKTRKSIHTYIKLDKKLSIPQWSLWMHRLIQTMGSDVAIKNVDRLMRLPDFFHTTWNDKTQSVERVKCEVIGFPEGIVDIQILDKVLEPYIKAKWDTAEFKADKSRTGFFMPDVAKYLDHHEIRKENEGRARCPHHTKDNPDSHSRDSLYFDPKSGGYACLAGCETHEVREAVIELAKERGWEPPARLLTIQKLEKGVKALQKIIDTPTLSPIDRAAKMAELKSDSIDSFTWNTIKRTVEESSSLNSIPRLIERINKAVNYDTSKILSGLNPKLENYLRNVGYNMGHQSHHFLTSLIMTLSPFFSDVRVKINSHRYDCLNIYAGLVGKTGSGKTPVMSYFRDDLISYQNKKNHTYYQMVEAGETPNIPHIEYLISEGTIPGFIDSASNKRNTGILLEYDEGFQLFKLLTTTSGYNADAQPFFLKNFNGREGFKNLKGGAKKPYKNAFSLYFGIQPEILKTVVTDDLVNVGLDARILYSIITGFDSTPFPVIELPQEEIPQIYKWIEFVDQNPLPVELSLSKEANEIARAFEMKLTHLESKEVNDTLTGIYPKLKIYIYRLAGMIHLINSSYIKDTNNSIINDNSMLMATSLIEMYLNNAFLISCLSGKQGIYGEIYSKALVSGVLPTKTLLSMLGSKATITTVYDYINNLINSGAGRWITLSDGSYGYEPGNSIENNLYYDRFWSWLNNEKTLTNEQIGSMVTEYRSFSSVINEMTERGARKTLTGLTVEPNNDDNDDNDEPKAPDNTPNTPINELEVPNECTNDASMDNQDEVEVHFSDTQNTPEAPINELEVPNECTNDVEKVHTKPDQTGIKKSNLKTKKRKIKLLPLFDVKNPRNEKNCTNSTQTREKLEDFKIVKVEYNRRNGFPIRDEHHIAKRCVETQRINDTVLGKIGITKKWLVDNNYPENVTQIRKVNPATDRTMACQIQDVLGKAYESISGIDFWMDKRCDGVYWLRSTLLNVDYTKDILKRVFKVPAEVLDEIAPKKTKLTPQQFQAVVKQCLLDEDGKIIHDYRQCFVKYGSDDNPVWGLDYKVYLMIKRNKTGDEINLNEDVSGEKLEANKMAVHDNAIYLDHNNIDLVADKVERTEEQKKRGILIKSVLPTMVPFKETVKVSFDIETYATDPGGKQPKEWFDQEFIQEWERRGEKVGNDIITAIGYNCDGEITIDRVDATNFNSLGISEFVDSLLKEEERLLTNFYQYLQSKRKPDVIIDYSDVKIPHILAAHNGANFDYLRIYERTQWHADNGNRKLKKHLSDWIPGTNRVCTSSDFYGRPYAYNSIRLRGWELIDTLGLLACQAKIGAISYKELGLKKAAVIEGITAQASSDGIIEVGDERVVLHVKEIWEAIRYPTTERLSNFDKYLKLDVYECMGLFVKHFKGYYGQASIFPLSLQEILYASPAKKMTEVILFLYRELNGGMVGDIHYTSLKRALKGIEKATYEGGLGVCYPGIYSDMVCEDVGSQYPWIMLNYGIIPEHDIDGYFLDLIAIGLEMCNSLKAEAKVAYKSGNEELADSLIALRLAYKVLINGAYGLLGTDGYPFRSDKLAAVVTAIGRKVLLEMESVVKANGMKTIELATDGLKYQYDASCGKTIEQLHDEMLPKIHGAKLDTEIAGGVILADSCKNYIYWKDEKSARENIKPTKKGKFTKTITAPFIQEFFTNAARYYAFSDLRGVSSGKKALQLYYNEIRSKVCEGLLTASDIGIRTKISTSDKKKKEQMKVDPGNYVDYYYTKHPKAGNSKSKSGFEKFKTYTNITEFDERPYWSDYYLSLLDKAYGELVDTIS